MAKILTVQQLARKGGIARAKSLTKARRREIATAAIESRWFIPCPDCRGGKDPGKCGTCGGKGKVRKPVGRN